MHASSEANGPERPTDWSAVNWQQAERAVRNLRQRIFRASQAGDLKKVRSLQKLMLRSYSNTLLSVRRVTQVNQGKYTAGVDKMVVKTPRYRGLLVDYLMAFQPWQTKPTRRVYIPKTNGKLRPLGIPTIVDRCLQARVKNALEPQWEARFEAISYGFRPGRGCHDAIEKIYGLARPNKTKKWVLDADIQGAFDHISHAHLLDAIGACPGRELVKQWLTAGYMEHGDFHATWEGTPQGGVISPLLANIALHGMEEALGVTYDKRGQLNGRRAVVRYADDFVVFCETQEDALAAQQCLKGWLEERGLELSLEKTRIVHLTDGFDFLGFTVRHYRAPKTSRSGYKLLITPSKTSVKRLRETLRPTWRRLQGHNVRAVVKELTPVIRGWANYFRTGVAKQTFMELDNWMDTREARYARRMHPRKSWKWLRWRYWGRLNAARQAHWVFGDKQNGAYLPKFAWFPIERHILVKGAASPDDSTLRAYWERRAQARAKDRIPSERRIAQNQAYRCPVCKQSLFNDEEVQVHHRIPKEQGGTDSYRNLQLVHLYCHQQIHRAQTQRIGGGDNREQNLNREYSAW